MKLLKPLTDFVHSTHFWRWFAILVLILFVWLFHRDVHVYKDDQTKVYNRLTGQEKTIGKFTFL